MYCSKIYLHSFSTVYSEKNKWNLLILLKVLSYKSIKMDKWKCLNLSLWKRNQHSKKWIKFMKRIMKRRYNRARSKKKGSISCMNVPFLITWSWTHDQKISNLCLVQCMKPSPQFYQTPNHVCDQIYKEKHEVKI